MTEETTSAAAISLPTGFRIEEVPSLARSGTAVPLNLTPGPALPSLGPLAAFTGTWTGTGFNTIFRPNNPQTPTVLPVPLPVGDNILELNLTSETLSFSNSLGSVPNRGMVQGDVFLNGVPYLQAISDVTTANPGVGIHLEPGLWLCVPQTADPAEGQTLVRMASIPHGTTIVAQGTSTTISGKPTIPAVDITPFTTANPANKILFPSQTAANKTTPRIPQDLTSLISAGTITQAMLTDPNTVLRNHIAGQTITSTTVISIATSPAAPLFGGGTDNIAFLLGNAAASAPNAQTTRMVATFWIETVEHVLHLPIIKPTPHPVTIAAATADAPSLP
ncbi:MAG: heme-binding protein, partial [Acetobacteraceae bacterium]